MQPTEGPPGDARAVLDDLRRLVRELRESHAHAERLAGLSAAQLFVMQALIEDRDLSVNELAAKTYTHQSSVSVVVAKLALRGYLERSKSATDGRIARIRLTPAGRAALRRAPRAPQERVVEALARMPVAKRRAFADGLSELVRAMGVPGGPAGMFFEDRPPQSPTKRRRRAAPRSRRRVDH